MGSVISRVPGASRLTLEAVDVDWRIDDATSKKISSTAKSFPRLVGVPLNNSNDTAVLDPEFHVVLTGVQIPTPAAEATTKSTPFARNVSRAALIPTDVVDQLRIHASKK